MRLPSGDHAYEFTPSRAVVSCDASPPAAGRIQTCGRGPSSPVAVPRAAMNAMRVPSLDHCGAFSPRSPKVSCRWSPPCRDTIQRCARMSWRSPLLVSRAAGCSHALTE
jgi:hypothetical protein